jgi:hypothetical protein
MMDFKKWAEWGLGWKSVMGPVKHFKVFFSLYLKAPP